MCGKISSAIADNKVYFSYATTETFINKVIITTDMDSLINAIRSLNPWWANKPFQREGMIERTIQKEILESLKLRQIKDVIGVRRSGKTTLLHLVIDNLIQHKIPPSKIFFLSFDEINLSTASFDEIDRAIAQIEIGPEYLFLDEAQEKANWERWVKQLYDSRKFKKIFVSGSNASLLSKDVGKLLSGRHITTAIYPFSFKEFLIANGWKNFSRNYLLSEKNKILHYLNLYLKNGGFPETVAKDDISVNRILSNVYNDIISRDIATRHSIEREKIDLLAKYLFTNITKEYSYNNLAKNIGINIETVERYLNYLEESFLLFSLNLFSYKLKVQYKQNKKIYAIDNGLRNSIAFRFSEDLGQLYENAVYIELKRSGKEIYYWKRTGEVDFLIKEGLKIKELLQVCKNVSDKKIKAREIKGLMEASKEFKVRKAKVITEDYHNKEKINRVDIEFIPLWLWLLLEESN